MAIGQSFFASEEEAEDVAQETLIRLWKAWEGLTSAEEAERLTVRVAKYECINAWRREQSRPHTSLSSAQEVTHPMTQNGQPMEGDELSEAIRRAAGTLTKSEARLWRLFAEAGMTAAEISAITEINVRSVSTMLSHARSHIYKLLKKADSPARRRSLSRRTVPEKTSSAYGIFPGYVIYLLRYCRRDRHDIH